MRLNKARVQKYRSVRDTEWFEVEGAKTIMVGPNEAGKTAVLQALQQINPPAGTKGFDPLRDYPRAEYNDISTGKVKPSDVVVVSARFTLDPADQAVIPTEFAKCVYTVDIKLDNRAVHGFEGAPAVPTYVDVAKDMKRLATHADQQVPKTAEGEAPVQKPSESLSSLVAEWTDASALSGDLAIALEGWLKTVLPFIDEGIKKEEERYDRLLAAAKFDARRVGALNTLFARRPVFVLFSNYHRVKPRIHLEHLATRMETGVVDDDAFDYGNLRLLKLLGFSARELSTLGNAARPGASDVAGLQSYQDQLDKRHYQLNAASVRLTEEIRSVWMPDAKRAEADKLRVVADGQYLKVVVEDDLGVDIELDQRSEGFQWLVSFFVVFFAEAEDLHANAILLLDEPGLSLHGLKQRDFRATISRLAEKNQTLYTTHSPFLVGPDELDLVRVVEMTDRKVGTKVHTDVIADDPGSLLPLQEALGYDMAQSLFSQARNLVLEGLTDLWYLDSVAQLLRDARIVDLNEKIALVPAKSAGKVVYYATILHSQKLRVAALLDSDAAGDHAAQQDVLVHTLGNKAILRTKDAYFGPVVKPEVEDLLRNTLVKVAKADLGWDVVNTAASQPARGIVDIFSAEIADFSKYRLAKAFVRWTRGHDASELAPEEREQWEKLIGAVNKALK